MTELLLAGVVFLAAHVLPTATGLRGRAIARIGRPLYLALYSLLSILLLVWVVRAALSAPYVELWPPSSHGSGAALILMAPACWMAVGGLRRPNPTSVSVIAGAPDPRDPGPLALTGHPVMWAFGLWAVGHLLANGDLAAVLMFGAAAVFAVAGARGLDRRARRAGVAPLALAGSVGGRLRRAFGGSGWIDLLAAAALYGALLSLHPAVIGVDPLGLWG